MQLRWRTAALTAVTALALAGCSSSGAGSSSPGGTPPAQSVADGIGTRVTITGHLVGVGGPSGAGVQHWAGTVHVHGPVSSTVNTDAQGRFTVRLPAGRYRFTATSASYDGGRATCRALHPVVLHPGADAHVRVICQLK
jgi:hypothetical protein